MLVLRIEIQDQGVCRASQTHDAVYIYNWCHLVLPHRNRLYCFRLPSHFPDPFRATVKTEHKGTIHGPESPPNFNFFLKLQLMVHEILTHVTCLRPSNFVLVSFTQQHKR